MTVRSMYPKDWFADQVTYLMDGAKLHDCEVVETELPEGYHHIVDLHNSIIHVAPALKEHSHLMALSFALSHIVHYRIIRKGVIKYSELSPLSELAANYSRYARAHAKNMHKQRELEHGEPC